MDTDEPFSTRPILLVAAHPDDETIGAGGQLESWRGRVNIVHVTNGAPPNPQDALNAGCATTHEYAELRRLELLKAVAVAGIGPERCYGIGVGDQRASFALTELTRDIAAMIRRWRPAVVLTHPYEGGHPDHDATAFAVHAAAGLSDPKPSIVEFTSYHLKGATLDAPEPVEPVMETGAFLPAPAPALCYRLTPAQRQRKREMFDAFASQRHVLDLFAVDAERFRRAPVYDFTSPPHPGRLHYEFFDWGITGPHWREAAGQALEKLGLLTHATNGS